MTKLQEKMDHNKLNKLQQKAYEDICKMLDETKNCVITIDAPSGTGKTYLLSTLAATYEKPIIFTTFRKDQASEIRKHGIESYTYVSFSMHYFNLHYFRAIEMFKSFSENGIKELHRLLVYAKKFVPEGTNTIILDTYTIPSPTMLLLLYIVSLKCNLHLIFSGNSTQLDAIGKSPFHAGSNIHLIQMFTDMTINKLNTNMRTRDNVLENKITQFSKDLRQFKAAGTIKFHFNLRYSLYKLFKPKYFTEERYDTVYIAETHRRITARLHRFSQYLLSIGVQPIMAPFYYYSRDGIRSLDPPNVRGIDEKKFYPYLLLAKGFKYIYINEKGVHHVVLLEEMTFGLGPIEGHLLVRFVQDGRREEIKQCKLNFYQILPAYRKWLLKDKVSTGDLWQFPLRPYTFTYHATLGRTIEDAYVELSAECNLANFMYIGLCSVRTYKSIHKIHDEVELVNYIITDYMENMYNCDKYYYRCPLSEPNKHWIVEFGKSCVLEKNYKRNDYIDKIMWQDVDDIDLFECKKSMIYMRIKRNVYKKGKNEMDTQLMKIARFVKEKRNVILNAIQMARVDDYTGSTPTKKSNVNEKGKKKKKQEKEEQELKESESYVYLENEYVKWDCEDVKKA